MRFYSVMEVARLLKVNPETVRRWIRESRIGCLPGVGRQGYRITSDHLRAYLAKNPALLNEDLMRELSDESASKPAVQSVQDSDLAALQALRLKKLEELEHLDAMIRQKRQEMAAKMGEGTSI